jgi:hypothetical protein
MSNSLRFYQDSGLTVPLSRLDSVQADTGTSAAVDSVVYLGSTVSGNKFQAESAPGTAQIVLSIVDSLTGLQIPANTIKLELSSGGLAGATAGAALNLGTEILSGSGNALPVHVRIDAAAITAGNYDNLSLVTVSTVEVSA